ncbi:hypothetical protein L596_027462 [Steinernema carpocapsae]|uniref:Uncharacterized protein n=1 Tax=Steinernema carpocapsae TaxID=34508 RepID=A0A4U5LVJ6_STECR|nr:hypothetical protein L596_027462 [Steinernema carpocapsae]
MALFRCLTFFFTLNESINSGNVVLKFSKTAPSEPRSGPCAEPRKIYAFLGSLFFRVLSLFFLHKMKSLDDPLLSSAMKSSNRFIARADKLHE